jgi:hypothetical protein
MKIIVCVLAKDKRSFDQYFPNSLQGWFDCRYISDPIYIEGLQPPYGIIKLPGYHLNKNFKQIDEALARCP